MILLISKISIRCMKKDIYSHNFSTARSSLKKDEVFFLLNSSIRCRASTWLRVATHGERLPKNCKKENEQTHKKWISLPLWLHSIFSFRLSRVKFWLNQFFSLQNNHNFAATAQNFYYFTNIFAETDFYYYFKFLCSNVYVLMPCFACFVKF